MKRVLKMLLKGNTAEAYKDQRGLSSASISQWKKNVFGVVFGLSLGLYLGQY